MRKKGYIYIADDYTNNILKLSGYDEISDDDFKFMCFYKALVEYLSEYALKSQAMHIITHNIGVVLRFR